ncbi:MAG: DUF4886 domain-containing protein [Muribaculaceae bacterium]|nr:DUF4886 domain-containing protein [Muribaculaceae bacterium]
MTNRVFLLILLAVVALLATGCTSSKPDEPTLPADLPTPTSSLRILSVGNSFSLDAFLYVPYLMIEAAPEVDITIGILMQSGGALQTQHFKLTNDVQYFYFKWTRSKGYWEESTRIGREVLAEEPWDVVVLQQLSQLSTNYNTYTAPLDGVLAWLRNQGYQGKLGWLLTQSYANGYYPLADGSVTTSSGQPLRTSDEMAAAVAQCAKRVMEDYDFDLLLPCGTAVQRARHTTLNSEGDFGGLTADGFHMQEGIGRYIEACAVTYALLTPEARLGDINVRNSWNCPYPHSSITGMSPTNQALARQCAQDAAINPY